MAGFLWIALIAACGRSGFPAPEDCAGLSPGVKADDCWVAALTGLLRTDPDRVEREAEARITDDQTRDFFYLRITRDVDPSNLRWCNRIREKVVQERCKVLVRRPHLHRALGSSPDGTPGAPPPGAPSNDRGPSGGAPPGGPPPGGAPPAEP